MTSTLHRLGELVMDRLIRMEEQRPDLADPGTATSLPSTLDVAVSLLRDGAWTEWHATLEVHREAGTWWASGDGINAVGDSVEELAEMIVGAVDLATRADGAMIGE